MKYRLNYTFRGHQITVSVLFGHSCRFYNDDLNNTNMEFGKTITLTSWWYYQEIALALKN